MFLLEIARVSLAATWLTLVTQCPAPPEANLIPRGPQPPGKQRDSYQAGYSKGLGVISQEPGENQTFLWNVPSLDHPDLLRSFLKTPLS